MGRKWRRQKLTLSTGFILTAILTSQALAQHPAVKLIDVDGNSVSENLDTSKTVTVQSRSGSSVTLPRGTPVSFEKTCSQCHEGIVDDVRASHHGAVGLHDMGWMDNHETKGDDTGTKDFVTNAVLKMRYFRSKSHYGGW
ncbi:MAG: hypothetical protein ABGX17_01950 [Desulfurobacteriaceae bacterium]